MLLYDDWLEGEGKDTGKSTGYITVDPYWFWLKRQQSIININNENS